MRAFLAQRPEGHLAAEPEQGENVDGTRALDEHPTEAAPATPNDAEPTPGFQQVTEPAPDDGQRALPPEDGSSSERAETPPLTDEQPERANTPESNDAAPSSPAPTPPQIAPASTAGPGGSDTGVAEGAMPLAPALDTTDPGALLGSVTGTAPSQLTAAYDAARDASAETLETQRESTAESVPEIATPTGMAPAESPAGPTRPDMPAAGEPALDVPAASTPEPPAPEVDAAEMPPAPPQPATRLTESGQAGEEGATNDPALAASARSSLSAIAIPPAATPTADAPRVQLTGEADPQRMTEAQSAAATEVAASRATAEAATHADFGVADIAPAPAEGTLTAGAEIRAASAVAAPTVAAPALPPEMQASVDGDARDPLQTKLAAERERYAAGQQQFETDRDAALADADRQIETLDTDARAQQQTVRSAADTEVQTARDDWRSEIEQVETDARAEADAARADHSERIQSEASTADAEAAAHIAKAEEDAAQKAAEADRKAEDEKKSAEEESGGFWGWVKSKAKALIDGIKSAVNAIYEGLRAAVKAIFDAAKALAVGVIELARKAITGLIKALGEALKLIVKVALAAFPGIADRFCALIDGAVERATAAVDAIAEGLKTAVTAVLDFVAGTLDKLLGLVQDLYNACFTIIGMLVSGEWKAILDGLENLVAAAKTAPGQFETAAYEELLGGDLDQPLPPETLIAAGRTPPGGADVAAGDATGMPGPPWTAENVGVESVAHDMQLTPEVVAELRARAGGGDGTVEFGHSDEPDREMSAIVGQEGTSEQSTEQAAPVMDDGLSPAERAEVKWTLMKQGLAEWWSNNWPLVLAGGVLAIGGFIAANILTGGAVMAALPGIMTAVGALFAGVTAVQLAGHLRDYLAKGWAGDIRGGGKSLAKALAAGAVELLTWLTFKVGGLALKGAKAAAKGVARGAQALGRGIAGGLRRGAQFVVKQGKVLLKGIAGTALGRGVKKLDDLARGLLGRTRFKGFRIRIRARRFILEGKINPWVKLAEGRLIEVDGPGPGALEVDDVAKAQRDFDNLAMLQRRSGESIDDWQNRVRQIQDDALEQTVDVEKHFELAELADDFLDPDTGKIAQQSGIDGADLSGLDTWSKRQEVWAGLKLKGGLQADADFWRRIDNAYNADQLVDAGRRLDELEDAIKSWNKREKGPLLRDIAERRAKLGHKQRRLDAQQQGAVTDDELIDQIVAGGKGTDVYATSREQAERIQRFLESAERNASNSPVAHQPKNFHGPETHRGTGTAPDEPHLNVKGGAGGQHYEVHIYYPE